MTSRQIAKPPPSKLHQFGFFVVLVAVIVALSIGYYYGLILFGPLTWEDRAAFGDSFGALSAVFSGLAFAGVVFALNLQMEELKLQRQEMRDSRFELAKTAKAQTEQARLLTAQLEAMQTERASNAARRKREIAPIFNLSPYEPRPPNISVQLRNEGGQAISPRAIATHCPIKVSPTSAVSTGSDLQLVLEVGGSGRRWWPTFLTCTDVDGEPRAFILDMTPENENLCITEADPSRVRELVEQLRVREAQLAPKLELLGEKLRVLIHIEDAGPIPPQIMEQSAEVLKLASDVFAQLATTQHCIPALGKLVEQKNLQRFELGELMKWANGLVEMIRQREDAPR
ncbi:MAG: hypothetical protein WC538_22765 [Thermoanaerobaculia bacterium]|jgi:hypothetical protein